MGFGQAVGSAFANYFNFRDRASYNEYWLFVVFMFIVAIVAYLIDAGLGYSADDSIRPASLVFSLATLIPSLSISVRRLHDIGRSGWWLLLVLTIVGSFVLLYWACKKGEAGPNKYGNLQPA